MTSLHDLGLAYRKAKVDLYYSSHASLEAIADYEENLHANLTALLANISGDDESWVTQPEFIGGWSLAAKKVEMSCWEDYRKQHGAFRSAEELAMVKGIGLKTVEKNRDRIVVAPARATAPAAKPAAVAKR